MIEEIIVVEGRDDTAAIKRAIEAETLETHGFGIKKETWQSIEMAYKTRGIIIFTDPDHAGETIRQKLLEKFPNAKEAHLHREDARKKNNIGIENADAKAIIEALEKAKATKHEAESVFTMDDLVNNNLVGSSFSVERRRKLGKILGIGYGNSKGFLRKLNAYGIDREDFIRGVREL